MKIWCFLPQESVSFNSVRASPKRPFGAAKTALGTRSAVLGELGTGRPAGVTHLAGEGQRLGVCPCPPPRPPRLTSLYTGRLPCGLEETKVRGSRKRVSHTCRHVQRAPCICVLS